MSEKRTFSPNARQWRVLLHDGLEVLKAGVAGTEAIDQEGLSKICAQLDDMKMLAIAWCQVSMPKVKPAEVGKSVITNGAEPVRKRGGWPLGKKRGPRKQAAQVMQ